MLITAILSITLIFFLTISLWLFYIVKPSFNLADISASIGLMPESELKPILLPENQHSSTAVLLDTIIPSDARKNEKESLPDLRALKRESLEEFKLWVEEQEQFRLRKRVRFIGNIRFPKEVYEGDSRNITVDLNPNFSPVLRGLEISQSSNSNEYTFVTLDILRQRKNEFLEIELIAAGFDIDGDKKQKQSLASNKLQFQWSCLFSKSGYHSITFIVRLISATCTTDIGRVEKSLKVSKLDHLTQRQVWVLATLGAVISGALAIIQVLRELGIF